MSEFEEGQDPFSMSGSTEELSKEQLHKSGGSSVTKEGHYHVLVESVELNSTDKTPNIKVIMKVLEGTESDQINKLIYHRIYFSPKTKADPEKEQKAFKGMVTFLFEFGVLSEEAAFGKQDLRLTKAHWEALQGCQAIVKVGLEKGTPYTDDDGNEKMGKDSFKILWNNDVWNPFHEHVKDVPKDAEFLQYLNAPAGAGGGSDLDGV